MTNIKWCIRSGLIKLRAAMVDYEKRSHMENPFATEAKQLDLAYMNHLDKTVRSEYMSELEELEKMYKEKIKELEEMISIVEATALSYMSRYISAKNEHTEYKEKLDNLLHKMGKAPEDDNDDE